MCRDAVRMGSRIGVLATLPTTLEPTKNILYRAAREMGRQITLVDGLVKAFGLDQEQFKKAAFRKGPGNIRPGRCPFALPGLHGFL